MSDTPTTVERLFLSLPLPLSRWAYRLVRSTLKPDRREAFFAEAFRRSARDGRQGDYLEFGVFRGSSFISAYYASRKAGLRDVRFFAFDSFQGLPEGELYNWSKGIYACSKRRFLANVRKAGVDMRRVRTVEGYFCDSLTEAAKRECGIRRAAVVHLDCDLRSSTAEALEFITEMVDEGTVLIFDNWACFDASDEHGQRRAFRDWALAPYFDDLYDAGDVSKGVICTRPVPRSLVEKRTGCKVA
ncbi:MAG: TylF/MycF/NovP-related O-methyltransferase [Thermoguttaceae bacterium]